MVLPQAEGEICGPSCSVLQWQTASTDGQNASRQSRLSPPCQQALQKVLPFCQRGASLQCGRKQECRRQASQGGPPQGTKQIPWAMLWELQKYKTLLLRCTAVSFLLFDVFSILAVCRSTPAALPVAQGDILEARSQQVVPTKDSTFVVASHSARLMRLTSQPTWKETAEDDEQQKQKRVNDWTASAHHLQETSFLPKADARVVQGPSSNKAHAGTLLGRSSAEKRTDKKDTVDDLTHWSSEEAASDKEQSVTGVGPSADETFHVGLAVPVSSPPPVEVPREKSNIRVASPAGDLTPVNTAAGSGASTIFEAAPQSTVGKAVATVDNETAMALNLSSATPSEEGIPARAVSSSVQRHSEEPLELDKSRSTRRTFVEARRLLATVGGGGKKRASFDRETKEEHLSSYGREQFGVASQSEQPDENAGADEAWRSGSDEMVPIARAILEAAKMAAPELYKRVQNATGKASTDTTADSRNYDAGDFTAKEQTVARLKNTLVKALQAAMLKDAQGLQSLLLSAVAPGMDLRFRSSALISTGPTSCADMSSSSVGVARRDGQSGSESAAAARSTTASPVIDMQSDLSGEAKSDRKCHLTSPISTGEKRIYRTRESNAVSEQIQNDTNEGIALNSMMQRSISAFSPLTRQLFKSLRDLRLRRRPPEVTHDFDARMAEEATGTAFRSLKRAPSKYYRGLYSTEKKLMEERWVWEYQPYHRGNHVVKLRASYGKAPAAFKSTCKESGHSLDELVACASLLAAQDAMQMTVNDGELPADNVDDVVKSMVDNMDLNSSRMGNSTQTHSTNTDATEEPALDDQISLSDTEEAAQLQNLLSSLDIGLKNDKLGQEMDGREKLTSSTSSSGQAMQEDQDKQHEHPDLRRTQGGVGRLSGWARRSTDTVDTVTEVIDMTELGEVASFNLEAFLRQQTCGNLYSTLLLDSEHPRPTVECVLLSLSAHAREVAQRTPISTSSILVKIFARLFCICKNDEVALDLLRSAQLAIAESARKVDSMGDNSVANPGSLVNAALKSRPESIPFFLALITSLLVCQASLPYNMRPLLGYPVVPLASRVPLPAMQYMHRVGAFIELPPLAPSQIPLDLQSVGQSAHKRLQPWKRKLYRSLFFVWNLVYHMYHLGERPEDFSFQNVDAVFPWPWRLAYVGSCLWSERIPVRNYDGTISPRLRKTVDTLTFPDENESGTIPVTEIVVQKKADDVPPKPAPEGTLPDASPDTCGPDATHKVVVESPLFARLDLRPEAAVPRLTSQNIDFKKVAQRIAEAEQDHLQKGLRDEPELLRDVTLYVETCWLFKGTDSPKEFTELSAPVDVQGFPGKLIQRAHAQFLNDDAKQWNLDAQLVTRHDTMFSRKARLHTGFSAHFHNSVRGAMERFIQEARLKGEERTSLTPYVILFAGHSLGGALAQLAAWYAAIHLQPLIEAGKVFIFCITFGSPSVGDEHAYSEMNQLGIRFFRVKSDTDPVPVLIQDESLSSLHSPDNSTLTILSSEFTRIALRDHLDRLYFHGLLWSDGSLQPLRLQKWLLRLAATPMNWNGLVDIRLHPMNSHLYIYSCALTLLADTFRAANWSSMCAAPLMNKWPLTPVPASPDMELEMQRAHSELPERLAVLEETLGTAQREHILNRDSKLAVR